MNKQELIDKAVEIKRGLIGDSNERAEVVSYEFGKFYLMSESYAKTTNGKIICSIDEYKQRARELGWINGYKWGVEYPTNGKKPDLPDDVEICVRHDNGYSCIQMNGFVANWCSTEKFRIVDERYKPVSEISENHQNVSVLTESNQNTEIVSEKDDWFARDELPPVGSFCEMLDADLVWRQVEILAYSKKGVVVEWENKEFLQSKKRTFRPINSERMKFIEYASKVLRQAEQRVINDFSLGRLFDAGFKAPEDKQ